MTRNGNPRANLNDGLERSIANRRRRTARQDHRAPPHPPHRPEPPAKPPADPSPRPITSQASPAQPRILF